MLTRWIRELVALALFGLLAGCGGGSAEPPSEASATIGAAGGTLEGPDGLQLTVPTGALTQDTLIRIARTGVGAPALPTGYASSTPTYEFTPHGLKFNLPVTIRMPYTAPAGAAHADLFMAAPGEDWQAMQATVSNGMAAWSRLSFSYLDGTFCAVPAGNTDPYICVWPRVGAPLSATPATALVPLISDNTAAQWTLNAATTLHFALNYSAAPDCGNPRVRVLRMNNGVLVAPPLLDQAVSMAPLAGSSNRVGGSSTFDVPMTYADNGYVWFGLSFSCTRLGQTKTSDGFAHNLTVSMPATAAPAITQQPANAAVVAPATATFTATASGAPAPTQQWQTSTDGGTSWTNIVGATAASYETPVTTSADNGRQFRAVFDNGVGVVLSQGAVLTVTSAPVQVGGSVNGLSGTGLQLQNNAGDTLAVSANGSFTFASTIAPGATYAVTVLSQPSGQNCTIQNGTGTANAAVANVVVTCTSAGALALVANGNANTLSIFRVDAGTGTLTSTGTPVATGQYPFAVAVTPSGQFAYVTNLAGGSLSSYSIDNITGVLTPIPLSSPGTQNPYGIAMDPLGRYVWVANYGSSTVTAFAINPKTGVLTAVGSPVSSGARPYALAVHPTGSFVYVVNESGNSVSVFSVNASTGALTLVPGTIANSVLGPHGIVIDPTGRFAYVANETDQNVAALRINPSTGALTVVGYFKTGGFAESVVVHPNGQYVYATSQNSDTVVIFSINQSTGALVSAGSPVATGSGPRWLTIDTAGTHLYVTNNAANTVSAFSIGGGGAALTSQGAAVPTGSTPEGIALTP